MTPGQRIRNARLDAGLTLVALGRALGVKYQQIQAWESGRRNPGRKHLAKLAEVLGLALDDLIQNFNRHTFGESGLPDAS